jgi:hypothetical protein
MEKRAAWCGMWLKIANRFCVSPQRRLLGCIVAARVFKAGVLTMQSLYGDRLLVRVMDPIR